MKLNLRGFEVSRLSLSGICVKTRTSSKWRNVFDHLLCLNVSGFLFFTRRVSKPSSLIDRITIDDDTNQMKWIEREKLTFHDDNSENYFNVYFGQSLSLSFHDIRDWSRWWENFIQFFLAFLARHFEWVIGNFSARRERLAIVSFPGNVINISMKPHKLDLGPYQFSSEPYNNLLYRNVKLLRKSKIFWNLLALAETCQKTREISSCREARRRLPNGYFCKYTVLSRVLCRVLHWN